MLFRSPKGKKREERNYDKYIETDPKKRIKTYGDVTEITPNTNKPTVIRTRSGAVNENIAAKTIKIPKPSGYTDKKGNVIKTKLDPALKRLAKIEQERKKLQNYVDGTRSWYQTLKSSSKEKKLVDERLKELKAQKTAYIDSFRNVPLKKIKERGSWVFTGTIDKGISTIEDARKTNKYAKPSGE